MIKCPFCGTSCVANTIYCSECGHYLLKNEDRATDPLDQDETDKLPESVESDRQATSSTSIDIPQAIRLKIGAREREIEISLDKVVHLGRIDPEFDVFPEIDLSEHSPAKNISRRHASIQKRNGMVIAQDLGSINGTFINGKRLDPFIPEVVQDGDCLHLGKLRIEVEILTK